MRIVIATIKSWNINKAKELKERLFPQYEVYIIDNNEDFTYEEISKINPDYIFFPHWSHYISKEVFSKWNCVVFHETDLPYGRGGSPIQNLIVNGKTETKISAIKVVEDIDAGPIYLKEDLYLSGSAKEIFIRCSNIIFEKMIPTILEGKLEAIPQSGDVTYFVRRKKEQSRLNEEMEMDTLYDYIRMLDAEGYPNAFIEFGDYYLKFSDACFNDKGELEAKVRFTRDEK